MMIRILLQVCDFRCSQPKGQPLLLLAILAGVWLLALWIGRRKKGDRTMKATWKIGVVVSLVVAVVVVFAVKQGDRANAESGQTTGLPRLVDFGRETCIPCKMMMPVLDELRREYADRLNVEFVNTQENKEEAKMHGIKLIPTQIFFDAAGKELFRHEGFFSKEDILAKWKELDVDLSSPTTDRPAFERLVPAQSDTRPKDSVCYMCDGNINLKTLVAVQTDKGPVRLCGPHCYFIMYSCMTEDKIGIENRVTVTDWVSGKPVPISQAAFLCGEDETTGRPWIKAFADREAAVAERTAAGGSILALEGTATEGDVSSLRILRSRVLSPRCRRGDRRGRCPNMGMLLTLRLRGRCPNGQGHRDPRERPPDEAANHSQDIRGENRFSGANDRRRVVRPTPETRRDLDFGRLFPSGVLRERGQPQEMGTAESQRNRQAHQYQPGAG